MPPVTYNRVPPSLMDRFTQQHRNHIAELEAQRDALKAKVALLEEQVRVQAATIRVLSGVDPDVCARAFGDPE